jgi:hypothetical protein
MRPLKGCYFCLISQLILQAYDVIMCAYDANESNRMCDVPMFSSNGDALCFFRTMNNILILHDYQLSYVCMHY